MGFRTVEISDPRYEFQGLRFITVKSSFLKRRADVTVFIPPNVDLKSVPVIVLLHGVYGSHWAWTMKGGAHQTLHSMIKEGTSMPFVLVMPSDGLWGDGSGYVPHRIENYESWIGVEIPSLMDEQLPQLKDSNYYIGGLSMGGYGAFRIGLKYQDKFKGISTHSAIVRLQDINHFVEEDWSFWDWESRDSNIDELVNGSKQVAPIRFDCGKEDNLFMANKELHRTLSEKQIEHIFKEYPGGHDWDYWKLHVRDTFKFFDMLEKQYRMS